jgi:hypothetical protein
MWVPDPPRRAQIKRGTAMADKTKFKIEFQYRPPDRSRPLDYVQDDELKFDQDAFIPIPDVGDTVAYESGGRTFLGKVLTRHFSYVLGWCVVNIVVGDVSSDEMAARIKQ